MLILAVLLSTTLPDPSTADERELAPVIVHEWGVLSWSGPDGSFSGAPGAPEAPGTVPQPDEMILRAPVLYVHGPEFTGRIDVRTTNGVLTALYPEPSLVDADSGSCSWDGTFAYEAFEPSARDMSAAVERGLRSPDAPRWPYHLWRTGESMTITTPCATESFLYYETRPERLDFLPLMPGADAVNAEWADIPAIVLKRTDDGFVYSECNLGLLFEGGDLSFSSLQPDEIHDILREWSRNIIDIEEVDALWNTWSDWICLDHADTGAYAGGLVLYLVPDELLDKLSTIEVFRSGPLSYPFRVHRYILAAVPL